MSAPNVELLDYNWGYRKLAVANVKIAELEAKVAEQAATIATQADDIDIIKQIESSTLPCGHHYRNGVTTDGGKTGHCTICEQAATIEQMTGALEIACSSGKFANPKSAAQRILATVQSRAALSKKENDSAK